MTDVEPRTSAPPFVSFLTTAYQTEHYVADTIESVLGQTLPDWELIVVDNGMSEEMARIVRGYPDPRITLLRQENRGFELGVAAAAGAAKGAVVVPLNSDDQLMPEYSRTMQQFLHAHPDVSAVGCDAHLFTDAHRRPVGRGYLRAIEIKPPPPGGRRLTKMDVLAGVVPYYSAAVRREAWEAVGGFVTPDVATVDVSVEMWLRLVERGLECWLLPDRLCRYRVRSDSISRRPASVEAFERTLVDTFESRIGDRPEEKAAVRQYSRHLQYHQAIRRARWALGAGDVAGARQHARDAWSLERTLRVALIRVLLAVSPRLLMVVHPVKDKVTRLLNEEVVPVVDAATRRLPRRRPGGARRPRAAERPGRPPTSW